MLFLLFNAIFHFSAQHHTLFFLKEKFPHFIYLVLYCVSSGLGFFLCCFLCAWKSPSTVSRLYHLIIPTFKVHQQNHPPVFQSKWSLIHTPPSPPTSNSKETRAGGCLWFRMYGMFEDVSVSTVLYHLSCLGLYFFNILLASWCAFTPPRNRQ